MDNWQARYSLNILFSPVAGEECVPGSVVLDKHGKQLRPRATIVGLYSFSLSGVQSGYYCIILGSSTWRPWSLPASRLNLYQVRAGLSYFTIQGIKETHRNAIKPIPFQKRCVLLHLLLLHLMLLLLLLFLFLLHLLLFLFLLLLICSSCVCRIIL